MSLDVLGVVRGGLRSCSRGSSNDIGRSGGSGGRGGSGGCRRRLARARPQRQRAGASSTCTGTRLAGRGTNVTRNSSASRVDSSNCSSSFGRVAGAGICDAIFALNSTSRNGFNSCHCRGCGSLRLSRRLRRRDRLERGRELSIKHEVAHVFDARVVRGSWGRACTGCVCTACALLLLLLLLLLQKLRLLLLQLAPALLSRDFVRRVQRPFRTAAAAAAAADVTATAGSASTRAARHTSSGYRGTAGCATAFTGTGTGAGTGTRGAASRNACVCERAGTRHRAGIIGNLSRARARCHGCCLDRGRKGIGVRSGSAEARNALRS